jgi:quercetin dioxygenase-like cupin family protein
MKKIKSRKKARRQPATTSVKPAAKVALRGTVPSKPRKAELRYVPWNTVSVEELNPLLGRQLIVGQNIMLARVLLKKGCIVPEHSHRNEQVTFVLAGALKFWIDGQEIVVNAGEVLTIPPHMPHKAEALEDTDDLDVFNPPRADWMNGTDAYLR